MRWWLAVVLLLACASVSTAQDAGNGYALVIGVDDYGPMGLARLTNAESDARAVERYFTAQRYQVKSLIGRAAVALDYRVVLADDAHTTYDTEVLPAAQIVAHHNRTWERAFATLVHAADVDWG